MPVNTRWTLTLILLISLFAMPAVLPSNHGPHAWCDEPSAKPGEAALQPSSEQVNRLLDEVRGLRQDVKKLSELVEQRLTATRTEPAEKQAEEPLGPFLRASDVLPSSFPGTPDILFFSAKWCGPCQKMLPLIQELRREGWPIQIVDIDTEKQLASDFNVQAIPHLAIRSDKKKLDHITGLTNEAQLKKLFEKYSIHREATHYEFKLDDKFQRVHADSYCVLIDDVRVEGNSAILESEIRKHIRVRPRLMSTRKQIKDDVDALVQTRWFTSVEPTIQHKEKEEENILIYHVVERPIVRSVEYKGLKKVQQKVFDSLTRLKPGSPFDISANRECCRRIEEYYHEKGFTLATVKLEKGDDRDDREVVFLVNEGPKVYVTSIKVGGNEEEFNFALTEPQPTDPEQRASPEAIHKMKALNRNPMIVVNYTVADLLAPRGSVWNSSDAPALRGALDLIDRVKEGVQPENWVENGGECTLMVNEATLSFVVRASLEIHDQLHERLQEIRRENVQSIQFETAILETSDPEIYQRAGIKLTPQEVTLQTKLISDVEFDGLKILVEADGKKTRYIPKLTTSCGNIAQANWSASDSKSADEKLHLYMRGVLTADRKDIRLSVATNPDHLMLDFSRRQHRVGDGQVLLLDMSPPLKPGSADQLKGKVLVAIRPRLVKEQDEELAKPPTDGVELRK